MVLNTETFPSEQFDALFNAKGPSLFVVKVDPNQSYWPRILSYRNEEGTILSNPLHKMHPPLTEEQEKKYLPYL